MVVLTADAAPDDGQGTDMAASADMGAMQADAAPESDGGEPTEDAMVVEDSAVPEDATVVEDAMVMIDAMIAVDAMAPVDAMLPPEPIEAIVPEPGEEFAILFVGNSYTSVNSLDEVVCELARQSERFEDVICQRVTRDGRRLAQHATDAASGGELAQLLNPDDRRRIMWDVVVLQEQSQIPGFPVAQIDHISFVEAVDEINGRIAAVEAQTALLMTWARRDGDARNEVIFPDYPTMQTRLTQGYNGAAEATSTPERPVHVIAAGEAWRRTWVRDADGDFRGLYLNDGSHPSQAGTFLTALTILRRTISLDPMGVNPPEAWNLDPELVNRLRNDARGANQ